MSARRRFIAGAVCPECKAMDTTVMFSEGATDYRECVQCGFKDEMRLRHAPRELVTRVNTALFPVETQVVNIVMPAADSKDGDN